MRIARFVRAACLITFLSLAVIPLGGCSDESKQNGTLAPVLEADKAGMEASAAHYKQQEATRSKQPKSKAP
jgi:hypothetical protein